MRLIPISYMDSQPLFVYLFVPSLTKVSSFTYSLRFCLFSFILNLRRKGLWERRSKTKEFYPLNSRILLRIVCQSDIYMNITKDFIGKADDDGVLRYIKGLGKEKEEYLSSIEFCGVLKFCGTKTFTREKVELQQVEKINVR